jgi:hypothetical protein
MNFRKPEEEYFCTWLLKRSIDLKGLAKLVFRRCRGVTPNTPTGASSRFKEARAAAISPSLTRRANPSGKSPA